MSQTFGMATAAAPVVSHSVLRDAAGLAVLVAQLLATLWIVPDWTPSFHPTWIAAAAGVATTVLLLALRARRIRGSRFELQMLALFLAGMPLVYVLCWLWSPSTGWLPIELAGVPIYAALAWLGRRSPYVLAAGIAAHGLAWDSWHRHSAYVPEWYAIGCLLVDIGLGIYVALEAPRYARATAG